MITRSSVMSWLRGHPRTALAALAGLVFAGAVISQSAPAPLSIPTVALASEPLYLQGLKAKPTLTLALSVEYPTTGAAYRNDDYSASTEYVGYFDPNGCYSYQTAQNYYVREASSQTSNGQPTRTCSSSSHFSGNFLNWATASSIDILRYSLTGGDRVSDTASLTVLQRAYLRKDFFKSSAYFKVKTLAATAQAGTVPSALRGNFALQITNCKNLVFYGSGTNGTAGAAGCDDPQQNANLATHQVRVKVCDNGDAQSRPTYCQRYPNNAFKPVGNLQKYSDRLRVAVFGYLMEDGTARYGGVLRAPMKYVGPTAYDSDYNAIAGVNPQREWDVDTGVFIENPMGDAMGISGAINYINRFGRTGTTLGRYKSNDPVSELYYEALRYLQGLSPTPQAINNLTEAIKDGYPVYTSWTDPHPAVTNQTNYACVANNILTIGDIFTHADKSVPGNSRTEGNDFARAANTGANEPDFAAWTRKVGELETNAWGNYNPLPESSLANLQNYSSGRDNGFYIAGMAYWANTNDIRGQGSESLRRPGMKARTFMIDVNENSKSSNLTDRRRNQFYLAAKYGGFDRNRALSVSNGMVPFRTADNQPDDSIWGELRASGAMEAKTYFLASDAKALLKALDDVFAKASTVTGNIAGGSVSGQVASADDALEVYQGSFDPTTWAGDVTATPITLGADGGLVQGNPTWRASAGLATRAASDRNIVVGLPSGSAQAAADFQWANLPVVYQRALGRPLDQGNVADLTADEITTGRKRLAYLRGDDTYTAPMGWRVRSSKLGDIINSSVVYVGAPSSRILDSGYSTFYATNKDRVRAVYVGANDGMLHAFHAGAVDTSGNRTGGTGRELFAYIPSFVVRNLYKLAESSYTHQSYVDASPSVAEAQVGTNWKTVLVSGAGGGGQGVFALDVTNPNAFSSSKVLWEFSDADDVDVGNIIGRPQILKMRTSAPDAETPTYKWFAVFASGVNSYSNANSDSRFAYGGTGNNNDGSDDNRGNPVLFILDLSKPASDAWRLNTNYYKVALPNLDTAAKGMVGFAAKGGRYGEVTQIYAGDLQGNLWKLDFSKTGSANWNYNTTLVANNGQPIFTAAVGSTRQPITMEPELAYGPNGSTIVLFGTGKFLEQSDVNSSNFTTQSVYALMDDGVHTVSGRSALRSLSVSSGVISGTAFVWGFPTSASDTATKPGWYFDFPNSSSTGERQISGFALLSGQVFFGSILPATTSCEAGSGNVYAVALPSGSGTVTRSIIGIQGEPSVIQVARTVGDATSAGLRTQTTRYRVITKGSDGIGTGTNPQVESSEEVGRYGWREIVNYKALRN